MKKLKNVLESEGFEIEFYEGVIVLHAKDKVVHIFFDDATVSFDGDFTLGQLETITEYVKKVLNE